MKPKTLTLCLKGLMIWGSLTHVIQALDDLPGEYYVPGVPGLIFDNVGYALRTEQRNQHKERFAKQQIIAKAAPNLPSDETDFIKHNTQWPYPDCTVRYRGQLRKK